MAEQEPVEEFEPQAREGEHIAPTFEGESFHCMHCGVLAEQVWANLASVTSIRLGDPAYSGYSKCMCGNCRESSLWNGSEERCVDPVIGGGPRPHIEMPEDVQADYEEARRIIGQSPRGACALLRLSVNEDIKASCRRVFTRGSA